MSLGSGNPAADAAHVKTSEAGAALESAARAYARHSGPDSNDRERAVFGQDLRAAAMRYARAYYAEARAYLWPDPGVIAMTKPDHTPRNDWATGVYYLRSLGGAKASRVVHALSALHCRVMYHDDRRVDVIETDAHETTVNALVRECERAGVQR